MVQNMIGGSTSYEEQSLPDILRDIENWIDYAIELKPLIIKNKEDLIKNKFWYKISYEFQRTIDSTILYLNTILHDLDIVKNAISNSRITVKDVELLNNIEKKSIEY